MTRCQFPRCKAESTAYFETLPLCKEHFLEESRKFKLRELKEKKQSKLNQTEVKQWQMK